MKMNYGEMYLLIGVILLWIGGVATGIVIASNSLTPIIYGIITGYVSYIAGFILFHWKLKGYKLIAKKDIK